MGWDAELPGDAEARANIDRAAEAWRQGTWAVFRIVDAATDQVVGGVNLRFCDFQIAEASYFLRASARGRGFATRAVRLVARWAFDELGIERIELRAHPENVSSQRVAERAGFSREGLERSRGWPDGTRFDSILFSWSGPMPSGDIAEPVRSNARRLRVGSRQTSAGRHRGAVPTRRHRRQIAAP
jgi:RimJ/RimL family protein N-acetyltransferase